MAVDPQRLNEFERANLVAYLDGELNDAENAALTTKLTQSLTGRREVESLQKTWELLDHLPRRETSDEFVTRTLTEVRLLDGQGGHVARHADRIARRVSQVLVGIAVALVLFSGSYALARWAWPDPSARLARELPLAEHLDELREVGSFEFLETLDKSPEFNKAD